MELQYYKWLELRVLHAFFNKGHLPFKLIPLQETQTKLQSNDIRFRQDGHIVEFYKGTTATEMDFQTEIAHLNTLRFELSILDPLFNNYTDIPIPDLNKLFLMSNAPNETDIHIEVTDQPIKDEKIGILQINLTHLQQIQLTLSFPARKVFKRYQFVISASFEVLVMKIISDDEYSGPTEGTLADDTETQDFTSVAPLPLLKREIDQPKLSIRYKEHGKEKVLEMRLPWHSHLQIEPLVNGEFSSNSIVYL